MFCIYMLPLKRRKIGKRAINEKLIILMHHVGQLSIFKKVFILRNMCRMKTIFPGRFDLYKQHIL